MPKPRFGATAPLGRAMFLAPLVAFGLWLSQPATAEEASFNCKKATAADEKAVCASAELSRLDRQLQGLYREVRGCALMGANGAFHDDEVDWLAARHKCGADQTCLRAVYKKRIGELTPDAESARTQRKAGQCPDQ